MEQVERWAEYVRSVPLSEWKSKQKSLIDAQIIIGMRFRKNLGKTEEGRKILERLRKARIEKK